MEGLDHGAVNKTMGWWIGGEQGRGMEGCAVKLKRARVGPWSKREPGLYAISDSPDSPGLWSRSGPGSWSSRQDHGPLGQ